MNSYKQINQISRVLCFLFYGTLFSSLFAQGPDFVDFLAQPSLSLSKGTECNLPIHFQIKEAYHIQAAVVAEESLIPTVLTMKPLQGTSIGTPIFPEAEAFHMKGVETPLYVYSHKLEILLPFQITSNMNQGNYRLEGSLYYQTCDDFKCYFPREEEFEILIKVE